MVLRGEQIQRCGPSGCILRRQQSLLKQIAELYSCALRVFPERDHRMWVPRSVTSSEEVRNCPLSNTKSCSLWVG